MYNIDFKEFRRLNSMTQRDLADYLGIKVQGYISQMENGERPIPEKYICKILADDSKNSTMVKVSDSDNEVKMPREIFDKISQLIDANSSQRADVSSLIETVKLQQRTIERLTSSVGLDNVRQGDDVGCVDAK